MERILKTDTPKITFKIYWTDEGAYLCDKCGIDYKATKYLRDMYPSVFDNRQSALVYKGKYREFVMGHIFGIGGITQKEEGNMLSRMALTLLMKALRRQEDTPIVKLCMNVYGSKENMFKQERTYFSRFGFCATPQKYFESIRNGYFGELCKSAGFTKKFADEIFQKMIRVYWTDLSIGIIHKYIEEGERILKNKDNLALA